MRLKKRHASCTMPAAGYRGGRKAQEPGAARTHFYLQTMEYALGYFGSRVLYPARPQAERCRKSRNCRSKLQHPRAKRQKPVPNCWATCWAMRCTTPISRGGFRAACCGGCFSSTWKNRARRKKRTGRSRRRVRGHGKKLPSSVNLDRLRRPSGAGLAALDPGMLL